MRPIRAVALAAAALAAPGCERAGGARPAAADPLPNVVLVSIDTLRADHLGSYGYFRDTSPEIDAVASEGIVFERCLANMATTLPSHLSLFTGTHPVEHGVLANAKHGGRRFGAASGLRSFAETARSLGYDTAAFVSATPLKRHSGIDAGFGTFDQPREARRPGDATTARALAWLDAGPAEPFLLWLHLFDPHAPYDSPEPHRSRYASDERLRSFLRDRRIPERCEAQDGRVFAAAEVADAYDGAVRFADEQVGRLRRRLEALGLWRGALFVLLGDHGEGLCQHGQPLHGDVYDEQLHVPLVVRVPGLAPRRVPVPLSLSDVLPTVLALAGPEPWREFLAQATGRNVLAPTPDPPAVFSQRTLRPRDDLEGPAWVLTTERWKLVLEGSGGARLYDRERDPFELRDRASEEPTRVAELRDAVAEHLAVQRVNAARFRGPDPPADAELDPALLDELRALGYAE